MTLLLALAWALAAAAQEDPAAAEAAEENPLVVESQELIAKIDAAVLDRRALDVELEGVTGEERLVIQARMGRKEDEILDDLDALTENLLAQEQQQLGGTAALRKQVEDYSDRVTKGLERLAAQSEADVDALAAKREELAPDGLLAFEARLADQNARIDRYYKALLKHADRIESLGVDPSPLREFLARELRDRAESLEGRIDLSLEQIADLTRQAQESPNDAEMAMRLRAAQRKLEWSTGSLAAASDILGAVGGDAAPYKQLLIRATGEITGDIFDTEVALGLFAQWLDGTRKWVLDRGPGFIFKLFLFAVILVISRVLANLSRRLAERALQTSRFTLSKLLRDMIISVTGNVVLATGVLIGLSQLGIQIGPLLAGIGIAGFIVGFALQDTLANFASGAMILLYRPYDEGDVIEAGGVFGTVSQMSLVSTTFLTFDHQTLVVPNSKIWGDVIKNVTAQDTRRVDMKFGISYDSDVERAETVLTAILKEQPKVLADPEPMVKLHELADSSVNFVVRPWVRTEDYWDVYWSVTREVKMRFDREGISIPFPQRDVHLVRAPDPPGTGGAIGSDD